MAVLRALQDIFDGFFWMVIAGLGWASAGALFIVLEVFIPRVCG